MQVDAKRLELRVTGPSGTSVSGRVLDHTDDGITLMFVANEKGASTLSCSIAGLHVRGSPFTISVGEPTPVVCRSSAQVKQELMNSDGPASFSSGAAEPNKVEATFAALLSEYAHFARANLQQ